MTIKSPQEIAAEILDANSLALSDSADHYMPLLTEAIRADRKQRDLYAVIVEALRDRADEGADDTDVAWRAAEHLDAGRRHIESDHIGPLLDGLQEAFGTLLPLQFTDFTVDESKQTSVQEAHTAWQIAKEDMGGASDEHEAANMLIEALMQYANVKNPGE